MYELAENTLQPVWVWSEALGSYGKFRAQYLNKTNKQLIQKPNNKYFECTCVRM